MPCVRPGELEAAVADLQRAIAVAPRYAGAHCNLAILLCEQKKLVEAVAASRTAVKLAPSETLNWQSLGWALYLAGDWTASLEALEKSCQLQPGGTGDCGQWAVMALAHARLAAQEGLPEEQREHHLAEARRRLDQADKDMASWRGRPAAGNTRAIWDFREEAAALLRLPDPGRVSALFEQGRSLLLDQKKYAEAETALLEAIRLEPDLLEAHEMLGWAFQSQGKFPEMEAAFRDVLRLKPDHASGHHGLGWALVGQKKWRDAIAPLREAVRLGWKDDGVYNALGWALVEQGEPAEAAAAFREVVRLKPDLADGHFGLGRALVDQRKFADAEKALRETLRIDRTHPWATELLDRALVGQGESAESEELKKPEPSQKQETPE